VRVRFFKRGGDKKISKEIEDEFLSILYRHPKLKLKEYLAIKPILQQNEKIELISRILIPSMGGMKGGIDKFLICTDKRVIIYTMNIGLSKLASLRESLKVIPYDKIVSVSISYEKYLPKVILKTANDELEINALGFEKEVVNVISSHI
jgi:hypothetical protein